ncbi:MAG TPA: 30S ribosomal protein S12 methylthiotransferase RimO [Marinilabiliaceae bacterium]|nr:30S ribosomal protein S12 methylthiotransferase RimO [Marinilabiliaceae bacterium]
MIKKRVDVVTLGCSKNLVDSELLIKQFQSNGYMVEHDSANPQGEVVVINTCGFIGDAKEESIASILAFADSRRRGEINKLFVMGCLSERYKEDLTKEIPEVDKFYGKFDWKELIAEMGIDYRADLKNERSLTTPGHYAYLKISEGCNRSCSYCAIPLITGKYKSRSIESLLNEAELLAKKGVKELQLIAQDLSYYGLDLYKEKKLAELVTRLSEIEGIEWIRLHYAYPAGFPMDVLEVMANNPKVCKYLDIALQHISDPMLKLMRRNVTKKETIELIEYMRKVVPGIHLRTTMITGHPNETEADFAELLDFVEEMKFERLGVFPYSHEEDTHAFKNYKDNVPERIKQERADEIMALQSNISLAHNKSKIGTRLKVIIDRKEDDYWIGRTEFDSPEVDPEVLISSKIDLEVGAFYNVQITGAEEYDLFAELK